jgi:orotate phosphoribosyltransferase
MKKGLDRIAAANTQNHSLTGLDVLAEVAVKEGYISPAEKTELIQFRDNL